MSSSIKLQNITQNLNPNLVIGFIIVLAGLARLSFIILAQTTGGDWPKYERFAENILNGCGMSQSLPDTGECIPDSGGYFPGYPAFIALLWTLFGKSVHIVLFAQLVCCLVALYWFLVSLFRLTNNLKVVACAGLLLALSPLQMAWSRYALTESLALTTSIWFLAEILNSMAQKKLKVFHLAAALTAAVYIRPDSIFLALPAFLVSFYIYDCKKSVYKILMFVVLTSIPISGWMIRNMLVGHAPLSMRSTSAPESPGYLSWLNTWVINEYERAEAVFPIGQSKYSEIKFHPSKLVSDRELSKAQLLAKELAFYDGKPFPSHIDSQFQMIADEKRSEMNFQTYTRIYFLRAVNLLLNPISSWGWPLEIKDVNRSAVAKALSDKNFRELKLLLEGHITEISVKLLLWTYRVLLFTAFVFLAGFCIRNTFTLVGILGCSVAALFFSRLAFFVIIGGLESRYMVGVIPWVECSVVLWFFRTQIFVRNDEARLVRKDEM